MSDEQKPDISIVVPFYNRRAQVAPCLTALVNQSLPLEWKVEIVAVDNGSTDGTLDALAAFPCRVVKCEKRGPGAARNAGVRAARGDVVAFTDSDCVPDRHWLALLMEPFTDPEMLAAGGRIVARHTSTGVTYFTEAFKILNQAKFFKGTICYPPFFATANAAYRRDALLRVNGFDEQLWMSEDSDLTWRVMELGGKIAYCPDAVVQHSHRETFVGFFRQAIDYGAAAAAVFAKHRHKFGMRSMIQWDNWGVLSILPAEIIVRLLFAPKGYKKIIGIYDAIWRAGFTIGKLKGSLKYRVLFL